MKYSKCCIPNCGNKRQDVKLHKFPSCQERANKWLGAIKCEELKRLDSAAVTKLLVCNKHFETRFRTAKYLKRHAYPSLFTPEEIANDVPSICYDEQENVLLEHNYFLKRRHEHTYYSTSRSRVLGVLSTVNQDNQETILDTATPSTSKNIVLSDTNVPSTSSQNILATGSKLSTLKKVSRKKLLPMVKDLTPNCRVLYSEYKKSMGLLNYNVRAKRALKFSKEQSFEKMTAKLNPLSKKLFSMQIRLCTKGKKGRRFSLEEKIIALSILKQSPKCYQFLHKIFILPSKTTLKKLIASLDIKAGINAHIFAVIKDEVDHWSEKKKMCSIIFDEMALDSAVTYSQKNDDISGFVDLTEKKNEFADHALVFMLRGVVYKWQQPVAFYFSRGAVSAQQLRVILNDIIMAVIDTGLTPIALVSDQGTSFRSALKHMQENTKRDQIISGREADDTIEIGGASLSVIFDPSHLMKSMRNNFLTKDISFYNKISTWRDIVDVYKTDCEHTQARLLHKLNDEHVLPERIKKMKVKNCIRVLSKTMAAALSYTAAFSHYTDGRPVSSTLNNTAETVSYLDDLFDSVNGSSTSHQKCRGKALKKAVTATSDHHKFWNEAQEKIDNMFFISKGKPTSIPTLKSWVTTIKSYKRVWQILRDKNVNVMRPRFFNSDTIENFFGRVRAYNFRNNDPTCHTFISTFKSLLITGFIKFHSSSYNCEDDACDQLIKVQSLFLKFNDLKVETRSSELEHEHNLTRIARNIEEELGDIDIQVQAARERLNIHSRGYTVGWVVRKTLSKLKVKCGDCESCLSCDDININLHRWISHREYKTIKMKKLTYPSECAVRYFGYIITESNEYLEHNGHKANIMKEVKDIILSKYSFDFINCAAHRQMTLQYFLTIAVKLCIFNWCTTINNILKGTDIIRLERRTNLSPMQKKALLKYKKKLKNKSFNK